MRQDLTCPNCRTRFYLDLDPRMTAGGHLLEELDEQLRRVLDRHQKDLAAAAASLTRSRDEGIIASLKARLRELIRQQEHYQRQADELAGRLAESMSDQTLARADVGTSVHTVHRQLADRVAALYPEIHAAARAWARADDIGDKDARRQVWGDAAAVIFEILFGGLPAADAVPDGAGQGWPELAGSDGRVGSLVSKAASLSEEIAQAPGQHRWIRDFAVPGEPFDTAFHEPWQNCADAGTVEFGVIPAYLVDLTVIARPRVFTSPAA
jgi:hypothetical protein